MTDATTPGAVPEPDAVSARRADHRFGAALAAGGANLVLLLAAAVALLLLRTHADNQRRARDVVQNLAEALSQEMAAELRLVDNALLTLAHGHRGRHTPVADWRAALEQALQLQTSLLPAACALHVADADGRVLFDQRQPAVNVADRDYFRIVREAGQMTFSAPLMDRLHGEPSIVVARRLQSADGGFDGVVFAILTLEHFTRMFRKLDLGSAGSVSLNDGSATTLINYTVGEPAQGPASDLPLTIAQRAVAGYPLELQVALATDDFLEGWGSQAVWASSLVAAAAAGIGAAALAIYSQRRRQTQAALHLQQIAREQAVMLDNELVGMARVRNRRAVWKNPALEKIFGYAPGELEGHATRALYLDDASYKSVGVAYRSLRRDGRFRTQLRMRRKDGSAVWIDLSGAPVSADESLWMLVDITALKNSEAHLKHMALHDPLTQLPNRTLFFEKAELMLAGGRRTGVKTAFCMLDLDGFKPVNDGHGHEAGDRVLKVVASRLQKCMREGDVVARVGGDEFAMAIGGMAHVRELQPILERVLVAVATPLSLAGGETVGVSASIGVALAPDQARTLPSLQRLADEALYAAKHGGRNRAQLSGMAEPLAVGHDAGCAAGVRAR